MEVVLAVDDDDPEEELPLPPSPPPDDAPPDDELDPLPEAGGVVPDDPLELISPGEDELLDFTSAFLLLLDTEDVDEEEAEGGKFEEGDPEDGA